MKGIIYINGKPTPKSNPNPIKNGFNSMNGDRISYCKEGVHFKNNDSIFLLISLILINMNEPPTQERIKMVIDSLGHIIDKHLNFTLFPQKEYLFNTEKFIDSLKEFSQFQYYSLYYGIMIIFKTEAKKTVSTDKSKPFLDNLYNTEDKLLYLYFSTLKYLSIRICGRLLIDEEQKICEDFIKNKDSTSVIVYLTSLNKSLINENNLIETNIKNLTETLKRKPTVLIMIAFLETQNACFLEKMMYHINKVKETNIKLDISVALDSERIQKEDTDYTPWSRVKRIRNLMIHKYHIQDYDYLYIIDSDIIDYPHNFVSRAIGLNPNGITAPVALIQYSNVFYDWCGYQKKDSTTLNSVFKNDILKKWSSDRNFNLLPPYVDDKERLVELDCVGCTYVVPSITFSYKYNNKKDLIDTFNLANVTNHKINDDIVQYEDHPTFTDHYTICYAVTSNGNKVFMDRGSVAYHADLPLYGEEWH